jgi:hypothetical protein
LVKNFNTQNSVQVFPILLMKTRNVVIEFVLFKNKIKLKLKKLKFSFRGKPNDWI